MLIFLKARNLKQLLQNTKYSIHYYQREYMWQRKHIEELIDGLTSEFLDNYKSGDSRPAVVEYGAYFMGFIVLAGCENAIIDGQQRFSSLTLLLMCFCIFVIGLRKRFSSLRSWPLQF